MSSRPRGGHRGRGGRRGSWNTSGRGFDNRSNMDWRTYGAAGQSFPTHPPRHFQGGASVLKDVTILGSYSTDEGREFSHDHSKLAYIKQEYIPDDEDIKVNLDLNASPDKIVKFARDKKKTLCQLLQWILSSKDEVSQEGNPRKLKATVVCARHVLTTIAETPYTSQTPWTICATKFRGTLYLCLYENETHSEAENSSSTGWGHMYKHYMQGGKEEVYNPNEEFRLVISATLGQHRILFAPEIDGVDPATFDGSFENKEALLFMVTNKELRTEQDHTKFNRFKMLKVWSRCHISGIPWALIGMRNDEGILRTIRKISVREIPIISQTFWTPTVIMNFLEKFLNHMYEVVEDNPNDVYVFERQIRGPVTWSKFPKTDYHVFLEDWFIKELDEED